MAYTNVWDDSAPLDTQAANQGAADFRQTKLDIMQRVASFGAGLLSARPTPEATSATANWTGVMYWATDTSQVFRWNGSSWDDISTSTPGGSAVKKYSDVTLNTVSNPSDGTTSNTVTTTSGDIAIGSIIRLSGQIGAMQSSGTGSIAFQLTSGSGTFNVASISALTTSASFYFANYSAVGVVKSTTQIVFSGSVIYGINGSISDVYVYNDADFPITSLVDTLALTLAVVTGFTGTYEGILSAIEIEV